MPATTPEKKAYNAQHALANRPKKALLDAIRSILAGRRTTAKTLNKFGWGLTQVNRIRALDARFKAVLDDTHNVNLDNVFKGTALPPLNALAADVQEQPAPAPEPIPKYNQGLSDNPKKGSNTPITWREIYTFWSGDLDKRVPGSNAVLKKRRNGQDVPIKLKDSTKEAHQRTFKRLMTDFAKQDWDDNAIPILRQADRVMAYFRETERKTSLDIERDRTVQDAAEGAVAGKDDDDEEISSRGGTVSRAANVVRARDKSSELKNVKTSYANKLASIVATWFGWKLFAESLGTDVLESYQGTFQPGSFKLLAAKQANKEVQGNRTNNPWEAIPSWELFNRFLPKVKEVFKATSTNYLACLLQVHLFGLRDNLGGVEIRETDGTIFDSNIGDPSRKDWFN
jgi:hypothetical protein